MPGVEPCRSCIRASQWVLEGGGGGSWGMFEYRVPGALHEDPGSGGAEDPDMKMDAEQGDSSV